MVAEPTLEYNFGQDFAPRGRAGKWRPHWSIVARRPTHTPKKCSRMSHFVSSLWHLSTTLWVGSYCARTWEDLRQRAREPKRLMAAECCGATTEVWKVLKSHAILGIYDIIWYYMIIYNITLLVMIMKYDACFFVLFHGFRHFTFTLF